MKLEAYEFLFKLPARKIIMKNGEKCFITEMVQHNMLVVAQNYENAVEVFKAEFDGPAPDIELIKRVQNFDHIAIEMVTEC